MNSRPKKQVECPNCGAWFRAGRLACPECGSDEHTGWKSAEEIEYASVEIPDAWPPDSDEESASDSSRLSIGQVLALFAVVLAILLLALS